MNTTPGASLTLSIRDQAARHGIAMIPFLTAGWPSRHVFSASLQRIAPLAAAIEVGIPFSDPMADGVTIQRSGHEALASGVTPRWTLRELERLRPSLDTPLVLMSYLNPLLSLGDELAPLCREAGVAALVIPDLPLDESPPLRSHLRSHNIGLISMVTPLTPEARLSIAGNSSDGFLYAIARTGVTGAQSNLAAPDLAYLHRCRAATPLPVCTGFGIRSRDDVDRLRGHGDGVIVGSALLDAIARDQCPARFLADLFL